MPRKTPIRHKVRSHYRQGRKIDPFWRGSGRGTSRQKGTSFKIRKGVRVGRSTILREEVPELTVPYSLRRLHSSGIGQHRQALYQKEILSRLRQHPAYSVRDYKEITLQQVLSLFSHTHPPRGDYLVILGGGLVKRGITASPFGDLDVDIITRVSLNKEEKEVIGNYLTAVADPLDAEIDYSFYTSDKAGEMMKHYKQTLIIRLFGDRTLYPLDYPVLMEGG